MLHRSTECGRRQPAGHHLAERVKVGRYMLEPEPAGGRDSKPGHHLIQDQQCTVRVAQPAQCGVETRIRWHRAHVPGGRLGDNRRDLGAPVGEQRAESLKIIIGQHDRVRGLRSGDPGTAGQPEGGHPGAGGDQQRVDVPVVVPGELDDHRAPGDDGCPQQRWGRGSQVRHPR